MILTASSEGSPMMVAELNPPNELTLHNLNNQTVPLIATQHKGDPHPLQHIGFCPFLQYFLWLSMTIIVIFWFKCTNAL